MNKEDIIKKYTTITEYTTKKDIIRIMPKILVIDESIKALKKDNCIKYKGYYMEIAKILKDDSNRELLYKYGEYLQKEKPELFETKIRVWNKKDIDEYLTIEKFKLFLSDLIGEIN